MTRTFHTRIKNDEFDSFLTDYACLFSQLERLLYLDLYVKKQVLKELKQSYQKKYGITARQFNALHYQLKGKMEGIEKGRDYHIEQTKGKIKSIQTWITNKGTQKKKQHERLLKLTPQHPRFEKTLIRYQKTKLALHHKKRRLHRLEFKLTRLLEEKKAKIYAICFGSRKLFKKQFHLEENGFKNHAQWKKEWQFKRHQQFFSLGSSDESFGNQSCTYDIENSLRIRVPDALYDKYGQYVTIPQVEFPYGQQYLDKAKEFVVRKDAKGRSKKIFDKPLSYRFVKKQKGWYVYASVTLDKKTIETTTLNGCFAVDVNNGFLTVGEVDRFGNPLGEEPYSTPMVSRTKHQLQADLGNAVKEMVQRAKEEGKSIGYEDLDFTKKKQQLGEHGVRYSKMLSSFAYATFKQLLEARAAKEGVEIIKVNPFATSLVGQFYFMKRYGLSSHGSAACTIARRALSFKLEKPKLNTTIELPNMKRHTIRKVKWNQISKHLKRNYRFNERIELLYV